MKIWVTLGLAVCVAAVGVACGDDDDDTETELPENPQLVNPGYLSLPITEPNATTQAEINIVNGGRNALVITSVSLSGQDTSLFTLGTPSATSIAARQAASIPITFAPTVEGAFVANVNIASNAEGFANFIVDVLGPSGEGTAAKLYAADKTVAVDVAVGDGTETRGVLRYYNVGKESLIVTDYAFGGEDAAQFSLATDTPEPGGACTANGLECGDDMFCSVPTLDPDGDGSPNSDAPGTCALSVPTASPIVLDIFYSGTGTGTATFTITAQDVDAATVTLNGSR